MRKSLAYIIMLFCFLSLVFTLNVAAQENIKITFYSIRTDEETWVRPLIEKFQEANPNITVEHFAAERIRYDEMVRTAIAGGNPVDVLEIDGQFVRAYQRDGLIEDMKKWYDFGDRFFPSAVAAVTSNDEILMVPSIGLTVCGFYTNDSIFEKYGLPQPKTWDDIQTIHEKLQGTGINTLVYSAGKIWWMPMLLFLTLPSYTDNQPQEFTMDTLWGKVKWDDPKYIQAYQQIIDFTEKEWLMKESLGYDIDGAVQDFIQGKVAMLYQGLWANDLIEKTMPEGFKYTFNNVPVKAGLKPQPAGGPGQGLAICSRSEHKETAAEFIKFLTTDENAKFMVERQGEFHGVIAANEKSEKMKNPAFAAAYKLLPDFVVFLDWLWEPEITSEFQIQIQAAISGQVTAEQIGKIVQEKYEQLKEEGRTYFWK